MIQGNTILITGGASGVGFELAQQLCLTNKVLICGRSLEKLQAAQQRLPSIDIFRCDVSLEVACLSLCEWVRNQYPQCNMLINNAAFAHTSDFSEDVESLTKAQLEFETNLMAPIRLCKLFMPLLSKNHHAKIVNVTTGLIYAPRAIYPFYNASKAALHSFTQVLRLQSASESIQIVEVMLPVVDTPWHHGKPPKTAISAKKAVYEILAGLANNKSEIKVGKVKLLYWLSRIAPRFTLRVINKL